MLHTAVPRSVRPVESWPRYLRSLVVLSLAFVLAYAIAVLALYVYAFIHEGGHILAGFTWGLLSGQESRYYISNREPYLGLSAVQVPQQTLPVTGAPSTAAILGGPLLGLVSVALACFWVHRKTKRPAIWIVFVAIALQELVSNVLYGTDSVFHRDQGVPLLSRSLSTLVGYWEMLILWLFLVGLVLTLYPFAAKATRRVLSEAPRVSRR